MAGSKKGEETTGKAKAKLPAGTRRPATSTTAARDASAGTRARADRQADPSLAARTGRSAQAPAPTPPNRPATRSQGAAGPVAAAEEGTSGSSSKRPSPVFHDDKEAMAAAETPTKRKKPPQLQPSAVTAAAAATAAALKKANVNPSPRLVPRAAAAGAVAAKTPPSMNMASAGSGTRARGDRQADYSLAARTGRTTQAPAPTPPHLPVTRSQGAAGPVAAAEEKKLSTLGNPRKRPRRPCVLLDDKEAMAAAVAAAPKEAKKRLVVSATATAAKKPKKAQLLVPSAPAARTPVAAPAENARTNRTGSRNTNMPGAGGRNMVGSDQTLEAPGTRLRSSSGSGGRARDELCVDCTRPWVRKLNLCDSCYQSRRHCRTCNDRRCGR